MKQWILLAAFQCLTLAVCHGQTLAERTDPRPDESQKAPVGKLGYPLGSYLIIEGTRPSKGKGTKQCLVVDTASGHKLPAPVPMYFRFTLPEGVHCVFKGYETGEWIGSAPGEVLSSVPRDELYSQSPWHFQNRFVIVSVVQPADFKPPAHSDQ